MEKPPVHLCLGTDLSSGKMDIDGYVGLYIEDGGGGGLGREGGGGGEGGETMKKIKKNERMMRRCERNEI